MQPDAIIKVRFKTFEEGGRKAGISGHRVYACPLFVDGKGFDCRIELDNMTIKLGQAYELAVQFLDKKIVMPHLEVGKPILLWEGRNVANGKILKVLTIT